MSIHLPGESLCFWKQHLACCREAMEFHLVLLSTAPDLNSSCHSHSTVCLLKKTTCKEKNISHSLTHINAISLKAHTALEPFCPIFLPFFILTQWQSKQGGANKAKITQTWSCSNSIIRNDEVSGPSPLLLWAGSSLCWNLSLQRVFSYITGFFMSNLGADIVEEKRIFQRLLSLAVPWCTFSFSLSTFSFRAPWKPRGTWLVMDWNGDCFVSETQTQRKNLGWNFPQQIWESGEEKKFNATPKLPCCPISVLLHPAGWWGFLW